jgi:hypothetical protein
MKNIEMKEKIGEDTKIKSMRKYRLQKNKHKRIKYGETNRKR